MQFKIKRLYLFILQTFFPVFLMTFGICLFIVLMEFIWQYVDDFVGKGLDNLVLAQLFAYAALVLIPMALPLSILVASLMAFGGLGERLELLAIKASGISLLKAMKPLMVFVGLVAVGAFFFQNDAMPKIQGKFDALLISIKQKSPELDIPEGSFYDGIDNYSLYVKKKDPKTKMLRDIMIYDTSHGFNDMSVFVCDSGLLRISERKDFLMLNLYHGQRFSNFNQTSKPRYSYDNDNKFVSYGRENFAEKVIIIPFDTKFNKMDASVFNGTQITQNLSQLYHSIDSMNLMLDSLNQVNRKMMLNSAYLSYRATDAYKKQVLKVNTVKPSDGKTNGQNSSVHNSKVGKVVDANAKPSVSTNNTQKSVSKPLAAKTQAAKAVVPLVNRKIDFDSLLDTYSANEKESIARIALSDAQSNDMSYKYVPLSKMNLQTKLRQFKISIQQKYTLSFACLIFFFIGAPLGAIIRKGGFGKPVLFSIVLFLIYYILNNVGYKMARDGVWSAWFGMWFSSILLFPLSIFLTKKAIDDSELFNSESYHKFFRKVFGLKDLTGFSGNALKEAIDKIPDLETLQVNENVISSVQVMDSDVIRDMLQNNSKYNYTEETRTVMFSVLKSRGAAMDDVIVTKDRNLIKAIVEYFQRNSKPAIYIYLLHICLMIVTGLFRVEGFRRIFSYLSLLSLIGYIYLYVKSAFYYLKYYAASKQVFYEKHQETLNGSSVAAGRVRIIAVIVSFGRKMKNKFKFFAWIIALFLFVCYPIVYIFIRKQMNAEMSRGEN